MCRRVDICIHSLFNVVDLPAGVDVQVGGEESHVALELHECAVELLGLLLGARKQLVLVLRVLHLQLLLLYVIYQLTQVPN